ncbi:MFS transporter [Streptomyces avidinii]|uniref:Multidrug efflux pump Tap n=1 Tax=Streptomyces avidinii TaxID=1895 RepID=A0ABS4KZN4_STRAV|nr:MFS transporter [Streptomyces avidinii]MBP2035490.1 MFS family permease [Streptomyces avidinii]GGZ02108.1 putative multidrug-efflux transporter [Streptomyces avidinii]
MTGSYAGGSASSRRLTPLAALVAAGGISSLGMAATLVAVPWFVLHSTGSGTRTGLVATAEVLGLLCSAVLAGPVVDRLPVRATSIAADLLTAVAISLIPLLYAWDALPLPVLIALVFLVGAARGPSDTSKQLLLPGAMERAGVTAERATGCVEGARRIGMMAGAPLAGLLIATVGPVRTLYADMAAMALCALLVATLVPVVPRARPAGGAPHGSYAEELRFGMVQLRRDRLLGAMVGVLMLTNALDGALNGVLYPAYGTQVLRSSALFGAMITAMGAGALLGAALYGWAGHRLPRRAVFVGAFVLVGAVRCAALAAEPRAAVLLAVLALSGVGSGVVGPLMMSVAYERVPAEVRGRVFGLLLAAALAATPLGMLGAGLVLDVAGLVAALLGTGTLYLAVTLAPLVFPVWRELDDRGSAGTSGIAETSAREPAEREQGSKAASGAGILTEQR